MIVQSDSIIDNVIEWLFQPKPVAAVHMKYRVEPVLAMPTPVIDTPLKVAEQPCQVRRHQSPSYFAVSDNFGQTDFPVMDNLPDPAIFAPDPILTPEPPQTPPSRPRRKRSERNEKAARWIKAQVKRNGGIPPFKVIQCKFDLPKATTSRLRREIMIELMAA
jgi:hypothetical protein